MRSSIPFVMAVCTGAAGALGQAAWAPTGGPDGGRLTDQEIVGGVLFVSSGAGVARSLDGGETWGPVDLGIDEPVAIHDLEAIGGEIVAAAERRLFASADGGVEWRGLPVPPDVAIAELGASGARLYALARRDGSFESELWVTETMGQSWTQLPAPDSLYSFHAAGDVLVGGALSFTGFARSTDGGQTWAFGSSGDFGLPAFAELRHFESLPDGTLLLASRATHPGPDPDNGVWRSVDDGATWVEIAGSALPADAKGADLHLAGSGLLMVTESEGSAVWRSVDGGETWASLGNPPTDDTPHPRTFRVREVGGALSLSTHWLGVLRSENDGAAWALSNEGLSLTAVRTLAPGRGAAYAGMGGSDVWALDGGGWRQSLLPGGLQRLDALLEAPGGVVLAGTGWGGVFRSHDAGRTWEASNAGVPRYNGMAGEQWREIAAFAAEGGAIFAGTGAGFEVINGQFVITGAGVLRSLDGGSTWQVVNDGLPILGRNNFGRPFWDPMGSATSAAGVVYLGMLSTGVYRSANGGDSWESAGEGLPAGSVQSLTSDGSFLYAVANGEVYRRPVDGPAWTRGGPLPQFVVAVHARGDGVYAAVRAVEGSGVFVSTDHGAGWTRHGDAWPPVRALGVASRCGRVLAATEGLGVWAALARCPADVNDDGSYTTQDVLAFLNDWSARAPCADHDGDGAVDTRDVLAFLGDWTGGCP